jgi:hypothetical protein
MVNGNFCLFAANKKRKSTTFGCLLKTGTVKEVVFPPL